MTQINNCLLVGRRVRWNEDKGTEFDGTIQGVWIYEKDHDIFVLILWDDGRTCVKNSKSVTIKV